MRKNRLYYCGFPTGINAINLEVGDFINIRHPVIKSIWGDTMFAKKWEVLEPGIMPFTSESRHVQIKTIEVPNIRGAHPNA